MTNSDYSVDQISAMGANVCGGIAFIKLTLTNILYTPMVGYYTLPMVAIYFPLGCGLIFVASFYTIGEIYRYFRKGQKSRLLPRKGFLLTPSFWKLDDLVLKTNFTPPLFDLQIFIL